MTIEYKRIHYWLNKTYGKACKCEFCHTENSKRYEYALKKECSYSFNIENYFQLCTSCHKKYDMTEKIRLNMSKSRKGKHLSEITKNKMRIAALKRYING